MNYFYITGTSRGIGKALAEKLLIDPKNKVYGISRTNTIEHSNYTHISMDLSDLEEVKEFTFNEHLDAESVVLINNSGIVGPVKPVGKAHAEGIIENYHINAVAPTLLMNEFVKAYQDKDIKRSILNTSSGAGRHTIESWGPYCASKASLDMYTHVLSEEQNSMHSNNPIRAYSVAPGIVDTAMQDEIREVSANDFSNVGAFISYKENNQLTAPETVADNYIEILKNPSKYTEVIMDVRKM